MRCIFCKEISARSRSTEHIIPESLGNRRHVLPPGVVCDRCNNYFARKVEKPFLESPSLRSLRFHQSIENKKGRVPSVAALISPNFPATLTRFPRHNIMSALVSPEALVEIAKSRDGYLVVSNGAPPASQVLSRFLAKVALESMAARVVQFAEGLAYICDESQLDSLREHARCGRIAHWPVHARRIYNPDATIVGPGGTREQIMHESDFLVTPSSEWYFVLALLGLELAINLGGPEIKGYEEWLAQNNRASILYSGKNAQFSTPVLCPQIE